MPVEDTTDIDLGTDEKTFDELDRAAAKAIKTLEKRNKKLNKSISAAVKAGREQKRLDDRGGIYNTKNNDDSVLPSSNAPRDIATNLSKQDEKIEKKLKKIQDKIKKDELKQFGKSDSILSKILGERGASDLIAMGKNPKSFMFGIMKALPILGGVLAAKDIAEFIIDEIAKIDRFFKMFIDEVDNRIDAFRSLQLQSEIQAGITQRIITTASGGTDPRYSYNTFEMFNSNQAELEEKFQMTNKSGVD